MFVKVSASVRASLNQMSFLGELGNATAALLLIHTLSHTCSSKVDQPRCTMCVSMPSIHGDDCWVLTFSFTGYITKQLGKNQNRGGERRGGEGWGGERKLSMRDHKVTRSSMMR